MANSGNSSAARMAAGLFCLLFAGLVAADWPESAPEAFPQSTLKSSVDIRSPGHLVLFSPVREIRNEIRSEVMARLPVQGEGQLYEIARDATRQAARAYYLKQLTGGGAQLLFECTGIACGRSNVWANQIFQQPGLLGRDAAQDYVVAATTAEDGRQWLTLVYAVTRGNLREYVWVEHLAVQNGVAIPGYTAGASPVRGPLVVPWSGGVTHRFDWSADDRRTLNDWAADGSEVVLASFTDLRQGETLDQALSRSEEAAESLATLLGKTGISRARIRIVPVGPMVRMNDPARQGDRVEIVVVRGS